MTKIEAATRLKASRSQDWYSRMTAEQRAEYLKKYNRALNWTVRALSH